MKTRITAAVAAVILGGAAPVSTVSAFPFAAPTPPYEVEATGSIGAHDGFPHDGVPYERHPGFCAPSSATEGNANQQTRPVMQYGQTSGGNRC